MSQLLPIRLPTPDWHRLPEDEARNHLLIIDMQIDFCHEQGTLRVPGAKEDIRRLTEFIYRHAERITGITCSMDSHLPNQIFNPSWWVNEQGHHPVPFTVITAQDVQAGTWRPLSDPKWSLDYLNKLEEQAKKALVVWPYHALIGGVGNGLDPELWSRCFLALPGTPSTTYLVEKGQYSPDRALFHPEAGN